MATAPLDLNGTDDLLERVRLGDREAWDLLLASHRNYVRRVVELRIDQRLFARIDPSDVVQEALLEATRNVEQYLADQPLPFRLWLRQMACARLIDATRQHLEAECRSVNSEQAIPDRSSALLARQLLSPGTSVAAQCVRNEQGARLREAVSQLPEEDIEIILLRSFEELSNHEAAHVLNLDPSTVSKRFGRALLRLRALLHELGLNSAGV